jgi:hypothetical protein
VLEYCDQGSLRQLLNKSGPFRSPGGPAGLLTFFEVWKSLFNGLHSRYVYDLPKVAAAEQVGAGQEPR